MLREHPYRICFPVGTLLGVAGIAHWAAYAQGLLGDYRPIFHVTAQIQGFVSCFAAGFLLTMVPRRLQAAPPPLLIVIVVPVACSVTVMLAWNGQLQAAQFAWASGMLLLMAYVVPRIGGIGAHRRAPNGFVWIAMALLMGVVGAILPILAAAVAPDTSLWHQVGQDLLLQGMPLGLIVGVGSLALPLMTRDEAAPDGFLSGRGVAVIAAHVGAALALVASFWIAATLSLRGGLVVRALVIAGELILVGGLWRPPTRRGWNARLIWAAAWSAVLGLGLAAVWPQTQRAGLHVTFILGFALLSLAVSSQVSFGHAGRRDEVLGRPVSVPVVAALMVAATVARVAMELQPEQYWWWMSVAAVSFLAAVLIWAAWVAPTWRGRATPGPGDQQRAAGQGG